MNYRATLNARNSGMVENHPKSLNMELLIVTIKPGYVCQSEIKIISHMKGYSVCIRESHFALVWYCNYSRNYSLNCSHLVQLLLQIMHMFLAVFARNILPNQSILARTWKYLQSEDIFLLLPSPCQVKKLKSPGKD